MNKKYGLFIASWEIYELTSYFIIYILVPYLGDPNVVVTVPEMT